jgi:metal-responsive CopG/Arc/MetJ family transcriptional regulator
MGMTRMTLTLDEKLAAMTREASGGNVSRFVSEALQEYLEARRRRRLREELIAGCVENAEEDLEICREWASVDAETEKRVGD